MTDKAKQPAPGYTVRKEGRIFRRRWFPYVLNRFDEPAYRIGECRFVGYRERQTAVAETWHAYDRSTAS